MKTHTCFLFTYLSLALSSGPIQSQERIPRTNGALRPTITETDLNQIRSRAEQISEKYLFTLEKLRNSNYEKFMNPVTPYESDSCFKDSSFDARKFGWVTPVRDQLQCGSCWAFAATALLEVSYFKVNNQVADASEQELLNCPESEDGFMDCRGGYLNKALDYITRNSILDERTIPYISIDENCVHISPTNKPYHAVIWGMLSAGNIADVDSIKHAICKYGAVGSWICYQGFSFEDHSGREAHNEIIPTDLADSLLKKHYVAIIGWDDSKRAWLVKNSWGKAWGDNGFGWIGYESNQIGSFTMWILAEKSQTERWRDVLYEIMQNPLKDIKGKKLEELIPPELSEKFNNGGLKGADKIKKEMYR